MVWLRRLVPILFLAGLLGAVLLLRGRGVRHLAQQIATLATAEGPPRLDPEVEQAGLRRARGLPLVQRVDALLELAAQNSQAAAGEIELWVDTTYVPGSLSPRQCDVLEESALSHPLALARKASAALLLAERRRGPTPPPPSTWAALPAHDRDALAWELGLRGVRGEAPEQAHAWLQRECATPSPDVDPALACRALGALQPPTVDVLLERVGASSTPTAARRGATEGLLAAATLSPESRSAAIPGCIELLAQSSPEGQAAARRYLVEVSARDLGPAPGPWRDWWRRTQETLRRLGD